MNSDQPFEWIQATPPAPQKDSDFGFPFDNDFDWSYG